MVWANDFSSWRISESYEMNLTNAEHDELFDRLGITETDIIENSVIVSGTVRDMLEVLNHFQANGYRRKLRPCSALTLSTIF